MIYRLAQDVAAALAERGFPFAVHYGPDRVSPSDLTAYAGRIVIERDREAGDTVGGPIGSRGQNPATPRVRRLGCVATVIARASVDGARVNEHEHDCDQAVDALIVALYDWAAEGRSIVEVGAGRYLQDEEINGAPVGVGVVYRLAFTVARAVEARTFEGAARETVTLDDVNTSVRVTLDGENFEPVPPERPDSPEPPED